MSVRIRRKPAWVLPVVASAALAVGVPGGIAFAGHQTSDVKSYTGCLAQQGGTLSLIQEGDSPQRSCPAGATEAHFSGGDITKISVTGALTGGGDNGEVTIGLKPEATLPSGCSSGQVAKWNGSGWACAADNNTTYSAGTGLDLSSGNEFSIAPDYRVKNTPDCSSGQFATGFDANGAIQCAAPAAASGSAVRISSNPSHTFAGENFEEIFSSDLPEGTYALTATADLATSGFHDDGYWEIACELRDGSTVLGGAEASGKELGQGTFTAAGIPSETLTVVGKVTAPAGGKVVSLWCKNDGSQQGSLGPYGATLQSLKVGGSF